LEWAKAWFAKQPINKINCFIKNKGINNLTNIELSNDENNILALGLSFIPTPKKSSLKNIFQSSLERYFRNIRLRYYFFDKNNKNNNNNNSNYINNTIYHASTVTHSLRKELHLPSSFTIESSENNAIEQYITNTYNSFMNINNSNKYKNNVSISSRIILEKMKNHPDIIFKPADKNLGITLLPRTWYVNEIQKQLNDTHTYLKKPLDIFTIMLIKNQIQTIIKNEKIFSEKERKYIFENPNMKPIPCPIYGLPKLHKLKNYKLNQNNKSNNILELLSQLSCRPIVSCVFYFTTPLSQWIDGLLQPLVFSLPTILKDSKTFVNNIENIIIDDVYKNNCILFTADISSLYTMIPTDDALKKINNFLRRPKSIDYLQNEFSTVNIEIIISTIIKSLSIVLKNNYIEFNNETYLQINGTAMGQSCAVVFANIYVYELENEIVSKYLNEKLLLYYIRFIDDVFAILFHNSFTNTFINEINSLQPCIKFNCITSSNEVEFLDTVIYKGARFQNKNIFDIRIHQKITNRYLYIPFSSFHTYYNKIGWIKAELQRYIRNTSDINEYIKIKILFFNRLRNRGYHPHFLRKIMNSISFNQRSNLLSSSSNININNNIDKKYPLAFVSQHHPSVSHIQIKNAISKHWDILLQDSRLVNLYEKPIIAYTRSNNIKDIIIKSKYNMPPA